MLFAKRIKVIFGKFCMRCNIGTHIREPRSKCPILKGRFPSSFARKGRGLSAGLQSSSKAALHEYFRDCISSSSWVLSVSSCIPTQISTWHEVHQKSTCLQLHRRGIRTNLQVSEIQIAWHSADRRQPLPRQEAASIIFRLFWEPRQISKECSGLASCVCERNVQPQF